MLQHAIDEGAVLGQDLSRPPDFVGHALASGLRGRPEFEVFEAVVRSVAVDVMDSFVPMKCSAEMPLHDHAVLRTPPIGCNLFEHVAISTVPRCPDGASASLAHRAIRVGASAVGPAARAFTSNANRASSGDTLISRSLVVGGVERRARPLSLIVEAAQSMRENVS